MIKKISNYIFVLFFIFTITLNVSASNLKLNEIYALSAILIDADSGRVLWAKDEDVKRAIASTTKIMTCIVVLENGNLDDIVTVSKNASRQPEVKLFLKEGDKQRLGDLLYPLMLESSNDVAVAVAEHVGGTVENFCNMMTEKARQIGAVNTVFKTPNGLDDAEGLHMSTAYDLGIIAQYAMKNEKFVSIINTRSISIPTGSDNFRRFSLTNKDRLLTSYNGANGIKTGFTNKAGHCFVGSVLRGDMHLISVVLGSGWGTAGKERKWTDTVRLMDYGFNNFKQTRLIEENQKLAEGIKVYDTKGHVIDLYTSTSLDVAIKDGEINNVKAELYYPDRISAPIYSNKEIGYAKIYIGDEYIKDIKLVSNENIDKYTILTSFGKIFRDLESRVLKKI